MCAARGAVNLDAGAVDEQAIRHPFGPGKRVENVWPATPLGPAHEAVIERLLGAIDRRATDRTDVQQRIRPLSHVCGPLATASFGWRGKDRKSTRLNSSH